MELDMKHKNDYSEMAINVANVYMDTIDVEGFVFDFDLVWKWVGYSTKGNAKTKMLKELRENIDYKIEKIGQSKSDLNGQFFKCKNGGDRKTEVIRLTKIGFRKFLIATQTHKSNLILEYINFLWSHSDEYANVDENASKNVI